MATGDDSHPGAELRVARGADDSVALARHGSPLLAQEEHLHLIHAISPPPDDIIRRRDHVLEIEPVHVNDPR